MRMCEEGLRASVTSGVNTEEVASDGGLRTDPVINLAPVRPSEGIHRQRGIKEVMLAHLWEEVGMLK